MKQPILRFSLSILALTALSFSPLVLANDVVPGETSDIVLPPYDVQPEEVARNILVTFGELAVEEDPRATATEPIQHRGVTYSLGRGDMILVVGGPSDDKWGFGNLLDNRPITRYVKTPLLAGTSFDLSAPIRVVMEFEQPTPIIGFGYGFNSLLQPTDGSRTGVIGWVTLFNPDGHVIGLYPLIASRVLCCTEGQFDYADGRRFMGNRGLVGKVFVELTASYTPFDPQTGEEGNMKFFGIDWVRYQRTEAAPD
jgi:hypothetical protein